MVVIIIIKNNIVINVLTYTKQTKKKIKKTIWLCIRIMVKDHKSDGVRDSTVYDYYNMVSNNQQHMMAMSTSSEGRNELPMGFPVLYQTYNNYISI